MILSNKVSCVCALIASSLVDGLVADGLDAFQSSYLLPAAAINNELIGYSSNGNSKDSSESGNFILKPGTLTLQYNDLYVLVVFISVCLFYK